jgi:hypothetical protein
MKSTVSENKLELSRSYQCTLTKILDNFLKVPMARVNFAFLGKHIAAARPLQEHSMDSAIPNGRRLTP